MSIRFVELRNALWALLLGMPLTGIAQNTQISASRANWLHGNTSGLPGPAYGFTGKNMVVNIFEKAHPRTSHVCFYPDKISIPVTTGSNAFFSDVENRIHATIMASLISGNDVNHPEAQGIAFDSKVRVYNGVYGIEILRSILKANPVSEMLVTNHSYSLTISRPFLEWLGITDRMKYLFGSYTYESFVFDSMSYAHPFWLPVTSSGNSGQVNNTEPSVPGYDKLLGAWATAKNTLTVANSYDVTFAGVGSQANEQYVAATIHNSSSQGPTDDLRIKPDITAPGCKLSAAGGLLTEIDPSYPIDKYVLPGNVATNAVQDEDGTYERLPNGGTSSATAVVSGIALLLQQAYKAYHNRYMGAATLKGLVMHTADKIGYPLPSKVNEPVHKTGISNTGPDPFGGYGLINAKFAYETIRQRGRTSIIDEIGMMNVTLAKKIALNTIPGQPVIVSISWTDPQCCPAGPILVEDWYTYLGGEQVYAPALNSSKKMLVNDLDLAVLDHGPGNTETIFWPYKLERSGNSVITVSNGTNDADNYEQVRFIPQKDHRYEAYISKKGSLKSMIQSYALIVTGLGKVNEDDPDDASNGTCPERIGVAQAIENGSTFRAAYLDINAPINPEAGDVNAFAVNQVALGNGFTAQNNFHGAIMECMGQTLMRGNKQIINDESSSSIVTETENFFSAAYPNPTTGIVTVNGKDINSYSVFNSNGERIITRNIGLHSGNVVINISDRSPGLYIIKIERKNKQPEYSKVIKQ